ncbi:cupin domain-containing protein [Roseivirga sp. E12]|uniref:cupin domain-containing protein n=1 Tax=Roseivirga sp. E12 TaxID=2819237 RepID=UPI001ABBF4B1|nr:cupin domain-containing protein [Roseivirga sp. E12]MBO3698600.1 DUF861 domain-containing protein [Roseivirga sp. E12]
MSAKRTLLSRLIAPTLLLLFFLPNDLLIAQGNTLKPILLDKSALSGVGLEKVTLNAEPERKFFQRRLLRGEDLSVYVVSSQSWTTRMDNFGIDEVVYMLNGKAKITPNGGKEMAFQSNEFFFIPKGYTGSWQIVANDNYHYELSIITTERASSANSAKTVPELLDKDKLSGIEIEINEQGIYEHVLTKGVELTVKLMAEAPRSLKSSGPMSEKLIHLLSGQIDITDSIGELHTFYTGDFFLIPKGFTGNWQSKGHGIVKYLVTEKTA